MARYAELGKLGKPEITSWIKKDVKGFADADTAIAWMIRHICLALGEIDAYIKLKSADPDVAASLAIEKAALLELLIPLTSSDFLYEQHGYYKTGVSNISKAN